jgi:hypothetical protein
MLVDGRNVLKMPDCAVAFSPCEFFDAPVRLSTFVLLLDFPLLSRFPSLSLFDFPFTLRNRLETAAYEICNHYAFKCNFSSHGGRNTMVNHGFLLILLLFLNTQLATRIGIAS